MNRRCMNRLLLWLTSVIGSEQLWISRIFSSLFWLIGGMALFSLARKHTSFWAAMVGLAFYLCLPFSIIASRSFQPDPWMVMWILLTAWSADRWADNPTWKWTILTGILGGITIFIKVMAGFFIGGFLVLVVLAQYGLPRLFRTAQALGDGSACAWFRPSFIIWS